MARESYVLLSQPDNDALKGTNVAACIVPYHEEDVYATHDEKYGRGGYRSVKSIEERNKITKERRSLGMLVNVIGVGLFKLINDPVTAETQDSDWGSFDASSVVDVTPSESGTGSQITLSDAKLTRTVVTDDLASYVFNVYLTPTSEYTKIRWCLVLNDVKPKLNFITKSVEGGTTIVAPLLLHDKDDLELYYNTTRVFDIETWDKGATWLLSSVLYKNDPAVTPREVITRTKLDDELSWETVQG